LPYILAAAVVVPRLPVHWIWLTFLCAPGNRCPSFLASSPSHGFLMTPEKAYAGVQKRNLDRDIFLRLISKIILKLDYIN